MSLQSDLGGTAAEALSLQSTIAVVAIPLDPLPKTSEKIINIKLATAEEFAGGLNALFSSEAFAVRAEYFSRAFKLKFVDLEAFTNEIAEVIRESMGRKVDVLHQIPDDPSAIDGEKFNMRIHLKPVRKGHEFLLWNNTTSGPHVIEYSADECIIFPANKLHRLESSPGKWENAMLDFSLIAGKGGIAICANQPTDHSLSVALSPKFIWAACDPVPPPPFPVW